MWGEPERVHLGQLYAHECHQNVIEYNTTSSHQKKHMHNTGAVSWASSRSLAHHTQHKCILHTGSAQSGCQQKQHSRHITHGQYMHVANVDTVQTNVDTDDINR